MAAVSDRSSEENKETVTLIWFDPNTDGEIDQADTMETLRAINDYVLVYTNLEECISYIESVRNEKIFLVVSGTWAPVLLPSLIDLKQLEVVYIFCVKREQHLYLMEKYSKISGVFIDQKELDLSIRKNLHLFDKQVETFSFYDQNQKVSMNLSERTAEFLWFQLFKDVILRFPSNDKAKQQMIKVCRNYYQGNEKELQLIDKFEKTYTSTECIRWYTRETFAYKMVNKALRTEDVQQLHTFRFFICDLSSALAREYKNRTIEESNDRMNTTVYRGIRLTMADVEQFRSNEGKLISINGYLSASRLRDTAVMFAMNDIKRTDSVPVLFEIECPEDDEGENDCSIFADIAKFSDFPDEQEVLFDLGAVFKVESVSKGDDIWEIYLSATGDGQKIAREYIEETKKEMHGDSIAILFGSLLTRMGHYQRAESYFQQLLGDPVNENLAHIHNQLGLVHQATAEFDKAMRHFDTAYELMRKSRPPLLPDSAYVLRNMSHVLMEQGHYEKALEYCNRATEVLRKLDDSYQLEMAQCLHSTGSSYLGQRKYNEALDYYEQALNIKRTCLPENHVHIAETLNSIGLVHLMTKDIEKAFNFYLLSLEMYQICLPEDHPDIANVLHNIAECYHNKNQFDKALQHYHLALAMKEKCFPPSHPSIATTLNNISTVLSAKGEKEKALNVCLKALRMREQLLPFDHPDLAISLSSAGHKYEAMKENQHALKYFEKALEIRAKFLPKDDPVRKRTERHVLRMKRKVM